MLCRTEKKALINYCINNLGTFLSPLYMVTNGDKKCRKVPPNYQCVNCDYKTCHLSHWKKHIVSKKHKRLKMVTNGDKKCRKVPKSADFSKSFICFCGKSYKYRQGLSRHKKTCNYGVSSSDEEDEIITNEIIESSNIIKKDDVINILLGERKQNKRVIDLLTQQVELLTETQNSFTIHGNNNNMNSNNTNFNVQLFLNENCKDAISIQDFAKQLKITMNNISLLKDNEPKAITNIITENLKDYTDTQRPFHHHKKKWYVKDINEGWDKEGDVKGEKIIKNIKNGVSRKAPKVFVENNPNFLVDEKQGNAYAETMVVAMKDVAEKDSNKVLKILKDGCSL